MFFSHYCICMHANSVLIRWYHEKLDWIQCQIFFVEKIIWTWNLLWKRICYRSNKTQITDRILKVTPIHASVINQMPWVRWIHWQLCSMKGNLHYCISSLIAHIYAHMSGQWPRLKRKDEVNDLFKYHASFQVNSQCMCSHNKRYGD